ncbi:MAG TPA: hypothetical protein VGK73_03945 [Polyangiaceae bacterium]
MSNPLEDEGVKRVAAGWRKAQRQRLQPVFAILEEMSKEPGVSLFLDLCELTLMVAARVDGGLKWTHPRVVVHIRQRVVAAREAKRLGVELDPEQGPEHVVLPARPRRKRRTEADGR